MHRQTRPAAGLLLLLVVGLALALGCRQEVPPLFRRNQPPETTLTVVPESAAAGFYRYHVHWRGEDSDGRVMRYIFAITDTLSNNEEENWDPERFEDRERSLYTEKTDSVFVFDSARGRQTFNISAVDDFGRSDPTPARAFFKVVNSGEPCVVFLDVQGFRDDVVLPPCESEVGQNPCAPVAAVECTIPTYTNFKVRFTGSTPNGRITGFQWQGIRPGETDPEAIQPSGADSLFFPAGVDSTAFVFGSLTDTLWSVQDDIVTVYYYSVREDSSRRIATGNFTFRARVRDEARLVSQFKNGTKRIVLNYDPDSRLYRIAARDCPRCSEPNPPPYCSGNDSLPAGFLAGFDETALADTSLWIRFCEGDTLPQRSHVRFYSTGRDDSRDVPADPAGLRNVSFSAYFAWIARGEFGQLSNLNMPFSIDSTAVMGDYHLPDGTPWRGWVNGWGDAAEYQGLCPYDFTYYVAAVDENDKRDGTPTSIGFYVSGSPKLDIPPPDSVRTLVMVVAPTCASQWLSTCPDLTGLTFGADTVLVVSQHVPDSSNPTQWQTPFGIGFNEFLLTFPTPGHDHPRDSRAEIRQAVWGRIKSWKYNFDCAEGCEEQSLPGEDQWRDDPEDPDDDHFGEALRLGPFALDTLCTATPCGLSFKVALPPAPFGTYGLLLQGRDTAALGETCREPSDLGPNAEGFPRPTSDYGRLSQILQQPVVLRQLQDVRPYVPRSKPVPQARTPRKGWWNR